MDVFPNEDFRVIYHIKTLFFVITNLLFIYFFFVFLLFLLLIFLVLLCYFFFLVKRSKHKIKQALDTEPSSLTAVS